MANKLKIYLDPIANTLNVWWGNPRLAKTSEETADLNRNDVIVKDSAGLPIGIEIIGLFPSELNVAKLGKRIFGPKTEPFLLSNGA